MALTAADRKLLRREGLDGASADEIANAARIARDDGHDAIADQLGDLAVKVEQGDANPLHIPPEAKERAKANPGRKEASGDAARRPAGGSGKSRSPKRTGGRRRSSGFGRAARRATTGSAPARGAASLFWTYVGIVAAATLVALIVRNPDRFTALVGDASSLFQGVVFPKALTHGTTPATHPTAPTTPTRGATYA